MKRGNRIMWWARGAHVSLCICAFARQETFQIHRTVKQMRYIEARASRLRQVGSVQSNFGGQATALAITQPQRATDRERQLMSDGKTEA